MVIILKNYKYSKIYGTYLVFFDENNLFICESTIYYKKDYKELVKIAEKYKKDNENHSVYAIPHSKFTQHMHCMSHNKLSEYILKNFEKLS